MTRKLTTRVDEKVVQKHIAENIADYAADYAEFATETAWDDDEVINSPEILDKAENVLMNQADRMAIKLELEGMEVDQEWRRLDEYGTLYQRVEFVGNGYVAHVELTIEDGFVSDAYGAVNRGNQNSFYDTDFSGRTRWNEKKTVMVSIHFNGVGHLDTMEETEHRLEQLNVAHNITKQLNKQFKDYEHRN